MLLDGIAEPLRQFGSLCLTVMHYALIHAIHGHAARQQARGPLSVPAMSSAIRQTHSLLFAWDPLGAESSLSADLLVGRGHKAFNDGDALRFGESASIIRADVRWLIH